MSESCYIVAHHIVSSLGDGAENMDAVKNNISGIREITGKSLSEEQFYGAVFSDALRSKLLENSSDFTLLENGIIHCIQSALNQYPEHMWKRGRLVLTSTKGNINLLNSADTGNIPANRVNMAVMAEAINAHFGFSHSPIVISNACISGVSALLTAQKLLASQDYDFAVVAGGDLVSKFVVSGFQSLMAISQTPCKPYDKTRSGMTPGEGCAAAILTPELPKEIKTAIRIAGGGQSNDANHISGPSRTGEGLVKAVSKAFANAKCAADTIDFINAHGTATIYNDEMESIAFNRLGLETTPINSLKGYFGHTFAAAGLIETLITAVSLKQGVVLKTLGLEESGISKPLNLVMENVQIDSPKRALKTISGFGGTNAAIILEIVRQ